jgi:molybdopterin/thiamine biosynthesis adenylyltransferase/rhodanese-related sulfurtransferase
MNNLSNNERERYSRHIILKEFGIEGQLKLKQSCVLVVGAGGLGCPALLYLAAAGVGKIGIVDFDAVQVSNMQRQILYTVDDVGKNKVEVARDRLLALNPLISIVAHPIHLTSENILSILEQYDLALDCTDNFPTRYLLNDAGVLLHKPIVYGSVLEFEGQVAVFNIELNRSFSSNYRDLFPEPPLPGSVPDCSQAGVLGVLPGMIGSIQANEALKIITGKGTVLSDKLLIVDGLSMDITQVKIRNTNARDHINKLIDYEDFCGIKEKKVKSLSMKEITVLELQELQKSGEDFQLIDVREPHEYDICNLQGELIPMGDLPHNIDKISKAKKVIIHCRSGGRSGQMVQWLEKNHKFENLYNLKGGILAWAKEIDPSMPSY